MLVHATCTAHARAPHAHAHELTNPATRAAILIYEKYLACCCPFCAPSFLMGLCCKSPQAKTAPASASAAERGKEAPDTANESKDGDAAAAASAGVGTAEGGRCRERFFENQFADFIIG